MIAITRHYKQETFEDWIIPADKDSKDFFKTDCERLGEKDLYKRNFVLNEKH